MGAIGEQVAAIIVALIGLAIVAVLVGQNAKTSTLISTTGSALSGVIQAAVAPVTGGGGNVLGNQVTG